MAVFVEKDDSGLMTGVIDGRVYSFSQYGSEKAFDIMLDLVGILGEPFLTALAGNTAASKDDQQRELTALVFAKLTRNLSADKDKVIQITKRLLTDGVVCDNQPVLFATHFKGKLFHQCRVFCAALEAQFGDFFTEVRDFLQSNMAKSSGISPAKTSP